MNRRDIPAAVLHKLIELSDAAEYLSDKVIEMEGGIALARNRLSGQLRQREFDDVRATLQQMAEDLPVLRRKCDSAQSIYSKCRAFIDALPAGTRLELVEVKVDGHDLGEVRAQLKSAQAELAALRAVPTPSADIEERIRHYVHSMARPQITGICKGERLKVIWPGADFDTRGPCEDSAKVLPMMALLFPDAMTAALTREVERMTDDPLPRAERKTRIAKLEREIYELSFVEEALTCRDGAERSPDAPPAAVLGVRIAESKNARAA